jgi:hypothetical protein
MKTEQNKARNKQNKQSQTIQKTNHQPPTFAGVLSDAPIMAARNGVCEARLWINS